MAEDKPRDEINVGDWVHFFGAPIHTRTRIGEVIQIYPTPTTWGTVYIIDLDGEHVSARRSDILKLEYPTTGWEDYL